MSPSSAHTGEQHNAGLNQVYQFEGHNSFLIWNDELQDFEDQHGPPWRFDYSFLPQLPPQPSSQVLKNIANPSDTKSPISATFNSTQPGFCPTTTSTTVPVQPTNLDIAHGGLRIDNATTMPDQSTRSQTPVPAIITEPATRTNTTDDSNMLEPQSEGLHASYDEHMHYAYDVTPSTAVYQPDYTVSSCQSASALQDAFQFHSPVTRRNSVSSSNSGPVFSHYGTPVSGYQHDSVIGTPYSLQHHMTPQSGSFSRFPQWSPHSPNATWKPQSRKYSTNSLTRMSQQYITALQQKRGSSGISQTMPTRRKPRIEHSLSESSLFNQGNVNHRGVDGRRRAASVIGRRSTGDNHAAQSTTQLQLPVFQSDRFFTSPVCSQTGFSTPDLNVLSMPTHSSNNSLTSPFNVTPSYMISEPPQQQQQPPPMNMTPSPTFTNQLRPSDPPPSDFHDKPQAQMPIFQAPQFEGDIYTPQYKRRNAKGEWEGWCGLCQPGQWHNLKNSRYWDDKLRNHGICARTKRKFEDPKYVRIVNLEGDIITQESGDVNSDLRSDEWVVSGLDGSLRKREGLCGYCMEWIPMDGVRSKGKGKSVGWWNHAYKCHEQGRKAVTSDQMENPAQLQLQSQYQPQSQPQSQSQPQLQHQHQHQAQGPIQASRAPYFNLW